MRHSFEQPPHGPCVSRRDLLRGAAGGFGALALAGMLAQWGEANESTSSGASGGRGPLAPRQPHFPAKARSVIFIYMTGGVSHVDSFDPKPKLAADHGNTITVDNWQGKIGEFKRYLKAPNWKFQPYGQCGTEVSELFPNVGGVVDDLCVVRSMSSDHTNHYEATLGMHTGSFSFARPSMGSWISYGLGSENQNLWSWRRKRRTPDHKLGVPTFCRVAIRERKSCLAPRRSQTSAVASPATSCSRPNSGCCESSMSVTWPSVARRTWL
jgi:hypothetical protein